MKRKICNNCKHFDPPAKNNTYNPLHGQCKSGKLLDGEDDLTQADSAYGGGYEGYGDYIYVGINFGCIHFKIK